MRFPLKGWGLRRTLKGGVQGEPWFPLGIIREPWFPYLDVQGHNILV